LEQLIFFHILGIITQLTNIFQRGWNHQPDVCMFLWQQPSAIIFHMSVSFQAIFWSDLFIETAPKPWNREHPSLPWFERLLGENMGQVVPVDGCNEYWLRQTNMGLSWHRAYHYKRYQGYWQTKTAQF
jgi:hypothetical protein